MPEVEVGTVTHYYGHINVAIVQLTDNLKVGDNVHIKGHTSDFNQEVSSMQIEHKDISEAKAGDIIGMKVFQKAHPHDKVYKVTP
ncbi:MAG: translation elongation factor-like protein [Candidatus Omnitrophota bacterium]|jgi:translation elongation factor EF-1alpha|nr:MAG: translation elongation factor-like protein [Candidatus Omnitrophota bacterium]